MTPPTTTFPTSPPAWQPTTVIARSDLTRSTSRRPRRACLRRPPSASARGRHRFRRGPAPSPGGRSPAGTSPAAAASTRLVPSPSTARPASREPAPSPVLDVAVAEPSFDAEVAARDVVVVGRGHLHDRVVLHVQRQVAADAAIRAHGVALLLLRLVPRAGLAQLERARRHEGAGRADGDAVAAVHASRFRQRHVELGGDVRVEPAAG